MTSIAAAVADLVSNQRPVLLLDTCDFLDVVRGVAEGHLFHARSFRRVLGVLGLAPNRFQVVITWLVRHEWNQNLDDAHRMVEKHLRDVDERIDEITEACGLGGVPFAYSGPRYSDLPVLQGLVDLAERVMNQAVVLEREVPCVERALSRVLDKRRPSHKKEIKDSIHWEHYLELSRKLGGAGHALPRIFVSANKTDFWFNKDTPVLHPDLKDEADASGLLFFGKLDDALRLLGI
jgi:hypothetical protein